MDARARLLGTTALLLLIVGLALGLRLHRSEAQSLWYDEGFSVYLARMDLGEITARTAADIQPPLYYYLLHIWINVLGDSEASLRSLSALFGAISVGLIYALGRRLLGLGPALLAALLLAVSPLHVWYGQEARMYTLLVAETLLSSWCLLEASRTEVSPTTTRLLWWSGFVVASVAALYTHYFALFVLAFQGVYWLLTTLSRRRRRRGAVLPGLAAGALIAAAYAPWLPYLFSRYASDLSYWTGRLKLDEVVLDIGLSYVGGESMAEAVAISLGIVLAALTLVCLLAMIVDEGSLMRAVPFLLLYLLVPTALILVVAYDSPKFNARYAIVSSPAWLLLLAGGLAALWHRATRLVRPPGEREWSALADLLPALGYGALAAVGLLCTLAVAAYADWNAYYDPAFARADSRAAAEYVRARLAPDEAIILSSGHQFPVFDYYYPGAPRHLLPDSPTLDVTRTLDFSVADELNQILADEQGVWLVLWQAEIVDPVGYLEEVLNTQAQALSDGAAFPGVRVAHYRFPKEHQFSSRPWVAHPLALNFGGQLALWGYTQTDDGQVKLYWQALQPLEEDYKVSLVLRDVTNQIWGRWDGRPTTYLYPTFRWRPGQLVLGRYPIPRLAGMPPGDYGLELAVYTDADPAGLDLIDQAGAPQGRRAMLGAVTLAGVPATVETIQVRHPLWADLGGGIHILGADLELQEAEPGDRLGMDLFWLAAEKPHGDFRLRLTLIDASGIRRDAGTFPLTNGWHPTSTWQADQAWRGRVTFRVPIESQPGPARLMAWLVDALGEPVGGAVFPAQLEVLTSDRVFQVPQVAYRREANLGNQVTLVGADLAPDAVSRGESLDVTLVWQARTATDVPYTVFVHLLTADGQFVAGHDSQPVGGNRPTIVWVPGEVVVDTHTLAVPADLPEGEYVVEVGMYDAEIAGMPRLPVLGPEGKGQTDRVLFGPVTVR
jgi:mannosyltransferase